MVIINATKWITNERRWTPKRFENWMTFSWMEKFIRRWRKIKNKILCTIAFVKKVRIVSYMAAKQVFFSKQIIFTLLSTEYSFFLDFYTTSVPLFPSIDRKNRSPFSVCGGLGVVEWIGWKGVYGHVWVSSPRS